MLRKYTNSLVTCSAFFFLLFPLNGFAAPMDQSPSFPERPIASHLRTLASNSSNARYVSLGLSTEGRPIPALVIDPRFDGASPSDSLLSDEDPRSVVVVLGDPKFEGEFDSIESLASSFLKDEELSKRWTDKVVLVFIPSLNPDRPATTKNAQGVDLLIDLIPLRSLEARVLIRTLDAWDVDLLIDIQSIDENDKSSLTHARSEVMKLRGKDATPVLLPRNLPPAEQSQQARDAVQRGIDQLIANQATKGTSLPSTGKDGTTSDKEYYFIPDDYSWGASRLRIHGVEMLRVDVLSKENAGAPEKRSESNLEKGWLIPINQPLRQLASRLLESDSPDSLAKFGFFEPASKNGGTYPIRKVSLPSDYPISPVPKLTREELNPKDMAKESLSLTKLFDPNDRVTYFPSSPSLPRWLPDTLAYITERDGVLWQVDCQSGDMRKFEKGESLRESLGKLPEFAGQEKEIAKHVHNLDIWDSRFQYALIEREGDLYVYDAATETAKRLTQTPGEKKQLPKMSPDGKHVAYVFDNNLFVVGTEDLAVRALTQDGGAEIFNGYLDWVYQEEVYGRGDFQGYWWSPDSTHIAFLRLDESQVPTFIVDDSLAFSQSVERMRYPKAGQPNPRATLHIANVQTSEISDIFAGVAPAEDRLIVRVAWSELDGNVLSYQVQDRIQSKLDLWIHYVKTKESWKKLSENSPAWVSILGVPRWLDSGKFLWMSDSGGGRNLYEVDPQGWSFPLTEGSLNLRELLWVDPRGRAIVTSRRSGLTNTDLLSISFTGDEEHGNEIKQIGPIGGTHRATVHPSGSYIVDEWSDLRSSPQCWLLDKDGNRIRSLNEWQSDRFDYVNTSQPELITIPARDGFSMQGMLYRPTDWEDRVAAGKKLPVLFYVYGGPQAPTVLNRRTYRTDLWHRWLADQGIAVLLCDNRASLGNSIADTWKVYKNLGEVELRDLEDAVHWVHQTGWGDPERIGIWGWSYGGYFTSYAMTHSKLFRAGIAGAPVTDWRNYDTIYTERYMSTPEKNPEGYRRSSVVEAAQNLHGRLLILHGDIDDNVHMTNSLQLARALQKNGKQFEMMIYPGNRHSITDPAQSSHQYQLMSEFLLRELRD